MPPQDGEARSCKSVSICDSDNVPALVLCLYECVRLSYASIAYLLASLWRDGASNATLQKRASRGRVHVEAKHEVICRHPRPWELRERLCKSDAVDSLAVAEALEKIRSYDETRGLTYS